MLLALKASGVNIGKYELDLDPASAATFNTLGVTNGITCAGLILNSGSTSITGDSTGLSAYGKNVIISTTSSTSNINFQNSSGSVIMGLTNTNILINNND